MLIYEPVQFFKKHQDTEKLENMIASLVIVLPVAHIGGDLIVEHAGHEHRFVSENVDETNLKCIAFYSDCKHEINKIKAGYRIVLTYNLVLEYGESPKINYDNPELKKAVKDYFNWDQLCGADPNKFIYFLDHSYSENSLGWDMLKGVDHLNGISLYNIAKDLHLIPHLALVNIMHRFVAYCDEDGPPIIDRKRKNPDYEIIKLTYWIGPDNKKIPVYQWELLVDSYEKNHCICWNKTTSILEPYDQDYEEYQGNYGNVMQFWYRRAAIVLWRESDQEEMDQLINMKYAHFRA
jgi:hypothetical protein